MAAAAALLDGADVYPAKEVRARLIATADWFPQLENDVWGGLLDFRAAVLFPKKDLLRRKNDPDVLYEIERSNEPDVKITAGIQTYERKEEDGVLHLVR